jgi:hypothetical protein
MYQKASLPKTIPSPVLADAAVSEPVSPRTPIANEDETCAKIRRLIDAGRYEEAMKVARSRSDAPTRNALGVCLMRMGRPQEAVRIYRALVLDGTGLFLREHLPVIYKTNFAFALMLSGNVVGGINIIEELAGEDHPSAGKLRETVANWKAQLNFLQKLGLKFGLEPNRPLIVDGPIGELA